MSHENIIFDGDAFANEGMRGNLASASNGGVLLNLEEGSDIGIVAYGGALEVD